MVKIKYGIFMIIFLGYNNNIVFSKQQVQIKEEKKILLKLCVDNQFNYKLVVKKIRSQKILEDYSIYKIKKQCEVIKKLYNYEKNKLIIKQREKYIQKGMAKDTNNDKKDDVWFYFNKNFQIIQKKIDTKGKNGYDGIPDVIMDIDPNHTNKQYCLIKLTQDTNYDKKFDKWTYFKKCKPVKIEEDTKINGKYDGNPDIFKEFDIKKSNARKKCYKLIKIDTKGDGKINIIQEYKQCRLFKEKFDLFPIDSIFEETIYYDIRKRKDECKLKVVNDIDGNKVPEKISIYKNCKIDEVRYDGNENGVFEIVDYYSRKNGKLIKTDLIGYLEYEKGMHYKRLKQYNKSEKFFKDSIRKMKIEFSNNNSIINNYIAKSYLGIGNIHHILSDVVTPIYYLKAIRLGNRKIQKKARLYLAGYYEKAKKFKAAKDLYLEILKNNTNSFDDIRLYIDFLTRNKLNDSLIIKKIDNLIYKTNDKVIKSKYFVMKAKLLYIKNPQKSQVEILNALKENKDNIEAMMIQAILFFEKYNYKKAYNTIMRINIDAVKNNNIKYYYYRGVLEVLLNKDKRKKYLTRAIKKNKGYVLMSSKKDYLSFIKRDKKIKIDGDVKILYKNWDKIIKVVGKFFY